MAATAQLKRQLGLLDSLSLVVGIVIGAGIFLMPYLVARSLRSTGWILTAWIATGVLSFLGALAFAELGTMFPDTGGQYVYLREAWGPAPAFLCGWSHFLVSQSAALPYLSFSFAIYLSYFVRLAPWEAKAVALVVLVALSAVNYVGVRPGAMVQNVCTVAKVIGLAVVIVSVWFVPSAPSSGPAFVPIGASAFGVAMIACLQAYDGWSAVSFVAGEVKDPERNLLRALSLGMLIVVVVFVLANVAYLRVLTVAQVAGSDRVGVAATAARRALGAPGAALVSATILISILGSLNGRILTQPRVYFAQACDGLFFHRFAEVHPRFHTPGFAIVVQAVWGTVLLYCTSFETLIDYRVFGIWLLNFATVAGVIALRRRRPAQPRPYRMWGYPWTPLAFLVVAGGFLINTLVERPRPAVVVLLIFAAGLAVYHFWRAHEAPRTA